MPEIATAETPTDALAPLDESLHPDISHIETENDATLVNIFSAKQQRLLVEPLYSSLPIDYPFLAQLRAAGIEPDE
jgi:hypothetical protein